MQIDIFFKMTFNTYYMFDFRMLKKGSVKDFWYLKMCFVEVLLFV